MTTTILFDSSVEAGPGPLGNGNLVVALVDADSWTPVETMAHLDEVTDELSGGGYTRATISATVDWLGTRYRALPDSTPQITHDHTGPLWVVIARDGTDDSDRAMVRADLIEAPAQPLEPSWPDGILSITIHTGIETLVEGDGIAIDSSDPQNPVVSSTSSGGISEIGDLKATGEAAGLIPVTDGDDAVTLEPLPEGLPDASNADDGDVPTVASGSYVLAPPAGGTGDIELSDLKSTGEASGLIAVTDGSGGVTLEPKPSGGGGGGAGNAVSEWKGGPFTGSGSDLLTHAIGSELTITGMGSITVLQVSIVDEIAATTYDWDGSPEVVGTVDSDHAPMDTVIGAGWWVGYAADEIGPLYIRILTNGDVEVTDPDAVLPGNGVTSPRIIVPLSWTAMQM